VAVALAMARNRKSVAILEPFAGFAARKWHGVRATPRQLKHATARVFSRPANRAARQQIARLKIATIDRVVCELLRDAPVKISEICAGDSLRLGHFCALQSRFELNVESKIICAFQVRQRRWILCRQAFTEQLQRLQRDHPRRDAGAKIFRQERPQRLVLPRLNSPRAPAVTPQGRWWCKNFSPGTGPAAGTPTFECPARSSRSSERFRKCDPPPGRWKQADQANCRGQRRRPFRIRNPGSCSGRKRGCLQPVASCV